ncbi:chromate transporter [Clostridium sp. DL1XJH146]
MKVLWELFSCFFRIGAFTFGGGYVMLPIIQREVVDVKNWATDEEVIDYYAIGQSTPGIIAVNTATFIGYKVKGVVGAIIATLGMVTPSLLIIMIIAAFFSHFQDYVVVQSAFAGIRAAVVALLINAVIKIGKKSIKDKIGFTISIVSFCIVAFLGISPIWIIIASSIIGIFIKFGGYRKNDIS